MTTTNTTLSPILTELWSKAPNYALLALIVFLQIRTESKINERFHQLTTHFEAKFEKIDQRFDKVDARFAEIDLTLKDIRSELKIHDYKLGAHDKRLDKLEDK